MSNLSITQLLGLAANAGFSGDDLATAVAIALAESGGNPNAYNPEKAAGAVQGKGSFGLWQIYITAHPEFAGENLLDPQTNANAAFSVYSSAGNSFNPWSTYKNGAYEAQLANVEQVVASAAAPADGTVDTADVTDDGSTPDSGNLAVLLLAGGLLFYVIQRIAG